MKQNRFDPSKFSSRSIDNNSEPVNKGRRSSSDPDFDIDDIKRAIANLRTHYDYSISGLAGKVRDDYNYISNFIKRLYNTSTYELLENMIDEKFSDLKNADLGTVGQYFIGCRVKTSLSDANPGCSAICAGAMPRKDRYWSSCGNPVIIAENSNDGFRFKHLNKAEDKTHAYVYINYESLEDFPGFSKKEKKQLKSFGVSHIYIHGYINDDYNYNPLSSESIEVSKVKSRKSKPTAGDLFGNKNDSEEEGSIWLWLMILFIIIILIIFFLALVFIN
jgi:hypothetical protein